MRCEVSAFWQAICHEHGPMSSAPVNEDADPLDIVWYCYQCHQHVSDAALKFMVGRGVVGAHPHVSVLIA